MEEITPLNYVEKIKAMGKRERQRLTVEKLIDIILQVPAPPQYQPR